MNDKESKQRTKELIEYFSNPNIDKCWNCAIEGFDGLWEKRTDGIVMNLQLQNPKIILEILKVIDKNNMKLNGKECVLSSGFIHINRYSFIE